MLRAQVHDFVILHQVAYLCLHGRLAILSYSLQAVYDTLYGQTDSRQRIAELKARPMSHVQYRSSDISRVGTHLVRCLGGDKRRLINTTFRCRRGQE